MDMRRQMQVRPSYCKYMRWLVRQSDIGYSPDEFFRFVRMTEKANICTQPGCTTCYCGEFREYCGNILGLERINALLSAVTEDALHSTETLWLYPLLVIEFIFGREKLADCPITFALDDETRRYEERRRRERELGEQKNREAHEAALARKAERAAKRQRYNEWAKENVIITIYAEDE